MKPNDKSIDVEPQYRSLLIHDGADGSEEVEKLCLEKRSASVKKNINPKPSEDYAGLVKMTETKWTKGPWLIKREYPYYRITCLNRYLCEVVPTYDDKSQYNANLMVAAPDLYAALKETLEVAARNESGDYIERANAAMRKARGE